MGMHRFLQGRNVTWSKNKQNKSNISGTFQKCVLYSLEIISGSNYYDYFYNRCYLQLHQSSHIYLFPK